MDIAGEATRTNNSFGILNNSLNATIPLFHEYNCKPFQGDTNVTKGAKISSYCLLLLLSTVGNSLFVVIIKRNRQIQTITNYLVANMAISDILITVLAAPRKITEILLGPRRWLIGGIFGSALCKSAYFFQDISLGVSILSLVAISIDRYRAIVFPWSKQFMKPARLCKIILPLIWIISMGIQGVYFYIFRLVTHDTETYCIPSWTPKFDERKSHETHYIIVFVFVIAIPLCVVALLYWLVLLNLKRSRCKEPSSYMTSGRLREDAKVTRNIIAIVFAFVACVVPINVYGILFYSVWDWKIPCGMETFGFVANFILYSNASVNPCIYFALNDKYRRGLLKFLKRFHVCRNALGSARESKEPVILIKLKTFST